MRAWLAHTELTGLELAREAILQRRTDIADRMLAYLDEAARNEGLTNVQTRLVDARLLELERDSFDAAICRLVPTRKGMQTRPASSARITSA